MQPLILGREALAVVSEDTALAGRADATNFG
jgi:hypothetical protein